MNPVWRALFALPLFLHRLGIRGYERVLGIDWVVLTTTGHKSGQPRTVMLDVVGHDPARATWYVQPAHGRSAAWVRNVVATPRVTAEVRGRRFAAHVDDATGVEGAEVVLRFLRAHPWYGRVIVWFVGYVDRVDLPDDELRGRLVDTPVFAIREQQPPS